MRLNWNVKVIRLPILFCLGVLCLAGGVTIVALLLQFLGSHQANLGEQAHPNISAQPGLSLGWVFILFMTVIAYFLPSMIASRHRNARAIFWLNLLAGWTGIGWLVALIWGLTADGDRIQVQEKEPGEDSKEVEQKASAPADPFALN
jgi:hypothetical protein